MATGDGKVRFSVNLIDEAFLTARREERERVARRDRLMSGGKLPYQPAPRRASLDELGLVWSPDTDSILNPFTNKRVDAAAFRRNRDEALAQLGWRGPTKTYYEGVYGTYDPEAGF